VGGWRRGDGSRGGLSGAGADPRARHPGAIAALHGVGAPPQAGEDRKPWRGAFALTEPVPYVGVDTGMLNGKVRVAEWKDGEEPMLQVDKRGRFITNIASANFVTAAVNSDDPRIKGSCVVILEDTDEGIFDRGTPTKKLVHQLSSTGDPIFQPEGSGQPHCGRIHGEGRRDCSQLQSRRGYRSRLPPHPGDRWD
jgi:alkylation response protein AidB-like acyl-CoA dehydrogenase